jgi:chemotaxis protein CheZ
MSNRLLDNAEFVSWLGAMSSALSEGNEDALCLALAGFENCRNATVTLQVRRIATDLQFALDHFHADAQLIDLAHRQVPDARYRLQHVLRLTDDAAHRTMELVERSTPLANRASQEAERLIALQQQGASVQSLEPQLTAFVTLTAANMAAVRNNLAEVLLAQGYQDLSGQIIRGVMKLIQDLQIALSKLVQVTGPEAVTPAAAPACVSVQGPLVPGIPQQSAVGDQQDVDALLSKLGV